VRYHCEVAMAAKDSKDFSPSRAGPPLPAPRPLTAHSIYRLCNPEITTAAILTLFVYNGGLVDKVKRNEKIKKDEGMFM